MHSKAPGNDFLLTPHSDIPLGDFNAVLGLFPRLVVFPCALETCYGK